MAANSVACTVPVGAMYLEELPYENYSFDQTDYEWIVARVKRGV